jgi:hypothetical protein
MENTNNFNNGPNKQHTKMTTRKNATFSQGALNKTDVGEFQGGYFVMAEATKENKPHRTKNYHNTNKTTERHPPLERHKSDMLPNRPPHQQHRGRSTQDLHSTSSHYVRQEGDSNVSPQRSSPTRSPNRNRRHSPNSQPLLDNPTSAPLSPHKPRKAQYEKHVDRTESLSPESGSPPKDKGPSPTSSRWAGPAFSNAPPPSSLPLPDFPPFQTSSAPSPPPQPVSAPQPIPIHFPYPQEPYFYVQQSVYPPHYSSYTFPYGSGSPSLDQLSLGLRQMLHINEQVPAIPA